MVGAAAVIIGSAMAGCAMQIDVAAERSDQIESTPTVAPNAPAPQPVGDVDWGTCERFDIPPADFVGTNAWECGVLVADMDPFDPSATDTVELALTRHRATGRRLGSLLINPGGPGGSGVDFAWAIRSSLPVDILRSFDIVGWDPRGVGKSLPAITCGDEPDLDGQFLMAACAESTGLLAEHLAAPYSARDMEAIRVELGEEQLDYLGYSYGATLGASYAQQFPEQVGRFVLDGVTDPLIGSTDGYFEDGFPYYAADGTAQAAERFSELCDASDRCALGASSTDTIDDIRASIDELPTPDFPGEPDTVDQLVFVELLTSTLNYSGDWELIGTALADAADGDASAVASLVSTDTAISSDALDEPVEPFEVANIVIYCADFRHVITTSAYCDGVPQNDRTLEPVERVDVATPILVIGTEFDPLTPGKHAPDFADALGDAVDISWSGVGHTAFPAPTRCVDGAVIRYLIDGLLPQDGLDCPFTDQAGEDPTDEQIADVLFGHGDAEAERLLVNVFEFGIGLDNSSARCAARQVNRLDDRTISHVVLALESAEGDAAIDAALTSC